MEDIKENKNEDNFSSTLGLKILELTENSCRVILPVQNYFYNPINSIHGGVLFTVADVVSGNLAKNIGGRSTTLGSTFNFIAPGINVQNLIGVSRLVKKGKTISVIDTSVYDDNEKLLATGTFTFYNLDSKK